MGKIGDNYWVANWSDFKEFLSLVESGAELTSTLEFTHAVKDDGKVYNCFRPTKPGIMGALYVTDAYIENVMCELEANVIIEKFGHQLSFFVTGMGIDFYREKGYLEHKGKFIKYVYDDSYAYKLQKTQYRSSNPYKVLEMLCDGFWDNVFENAFKKAGYIE